MNATRMIYYVAGAVGLLLLCGCALEPGQLEMLVSETGRLAVQMADAHEQLDAIQDSSLTTGEKIGAATGLVGTAVAGALAVVKAWRGAPTQKVGLPQGKVHP